MSSSPVFDPPRSSKDPLLPLHLNGAPPGPSRTPRPKGLRWRAISLRRRELYVLLLFGLVYYSWTIDRMWNKEYAEWKRATERNAPDFDRYSHNDEMQGDNALTLALSLGFGAIEVDTWLVDLPTEDHAALAPKALPNDNVVAYEIATGPTEGLIVGHKRKDLRGRTLESTYLGPLLRLLDQRNYNTSIGDWVGVYEDSPKTELQLVIDFKSNGEAMWPYVSSALEPFLESGYLTTYNVSTSTWSTGPIRVIGTGNTPLSRVYHSPLRYIFYDAHLLSLSKEVSIPDTPAGPAVRVKLSSEIAPMASGKFPLLYHLGVALPPRNFVQRLLTKYTSEARTRGIKSRWWGAARYPSFLRRRLWMMMQLGGADWVGGDDLVDLAEFLRGL